MSHDAVGVAVLWDPLGNDGGRTGVIDNYEVWWYALSSEVLTSLVVPRLNNCQTG